MIIYKYFINNLFFIEINLLSELRFSVPDDVYKYIF